MASERRLKIDSDGRGDRELERASRFSYGKRSQRGRAGLDESGEGRALAVLPLIDGWYGISLPPANTRHLAPEFLDAYRDAERRRERREGLKRTAKRRAR